MRLVGIKEMFGAVADLFLPRKCRLCGDLLRPDEQHICHDCHGSLARTGYAAMPINPMEQRFSGCEGVLVKAVSPFFYEKDGGVAHLVHTLKYAGVKGLGQWLGCITAKELYPIGWFDGAEILVPVPLHRFKHWSRGFNQSMEIARGVGAVTGLPVVDCLVMKRWQAPQARRGKTERWTRRKGVYMVKPECVSELQGRHLVVVDDVCTTGSTMQEIVKVFSGIPGVKVSLLTVSVAH